MRARSPTSRSALIQERLAFAKDIAVIAGVLGVLIIFITISEIKNGIAERLKPSSC
jgi:hypothetical protein